MIELSGVCKRYGARTVLHVPALTLRDGGRYALIGANGSGKSTLLRILAGVLRQDAGTVCSDIAADAVAYLPQSPYAFNLSVLDNVTIALPGERDRKRLAEEALRKVGLQGYLRARGNRLSGGETQRMMLARMIAKPHKLLLLDEPTSATDISAEEGIEWALLAYAEETGCTLVFSSHAPGQALRLATDVLVLSSGELIESGPAKRVLQAPEDPRTQAFLQHWRI